jgi:hypothetical protein
VLSARLVQARPYDPETKGVLVDRANGYLGLIVSARTHVRLTDGLSTLARFSGNTRNDAHDVHAGGSG